jgi:hypothetical protein
MASDISRAIRLRQLTAWSKLEPHSAMKICDTCVHGRKVFVRLSKEFLASDIYTELDDEHPTIKPTWCSINNVVLMAGLYDIYESTDAARVYAYKCGQVSFTTKDGEPPSTKQLDVIGVYMGR